jgi:hypothetical protein
VPDEITRKLAARIATRMQPCFTLSRTHVRSSGKADGAESSRQRGQRQPEFMSTMREAQGPMKDGVGSMSLLGTLAEGFDHMLRRGTDEGNAPVHDVELDLIGDTGVMLGNE